MKIGLHIIVGFSNLFGGAWQMIWDGVSATQCLAMPLLPRDYVFVKVYAFYWQSFLSYDWSYIKQIMYITIRRATVT
jgi:hypothetical protein